MITLTLVQQTIDLLTSHQREAVSDVNLLAGVGGHGDLLVDCSCGETFVVPAGDDEMSAIERGFAAHQINALVSAGLIVMDVHWAVSQDGVTLVEVPSKAAALAFAADDKAWASLEPRTIHARLTASAPWVALSR